MAENDDFCYPDLVLDFQFLQQDSHIENQLPQFLPGNSVRYPFNLSISILNSTIYLSISMLHLRPSVIFFLLGFLSNFLFLGTGTVVYMCFMSCCREKFQHQRNHLMPRFVLPFLFFSLPP